MTGKHFPKPGDLFEGRYRIETVIGSGGFARVYLARDQELDREVALKILRPTRLGDGPEQDERTRQFVGRFRREARLVAKLRDPHTITMFDHGETDRGSLYMVTEYIDGRDLKEVVGKEAPLAAERVAQILEQLLSSLQEAHALGVLHRDIKPANIMLYEHVGRADQVKVLDFGIAKSVMADATRTGNDLTTDGTIVGTPRYMAPEQLRGNDLGPMTDLYSVGLVAYELLCARKANDADSTINIITRQVTNPSFRLPRDIAAPGGLRSIVDGLLIKDPAKRFQTTDDVLEALGHWRESRYLGPADAPTRSPGDAGADSARNQRKTASGSGPKPPPKTPLQSPPKPPEPNPVLQDLELATGPDRRWGLVAGGLLLVALVGAGVWFAAQPTNVDESDEGQANSSPAANIDFASDEQHDQHDEPGEDDPAGDDPAAEDDAPGEEPAVTASQDDIDGTSAHKSTPKFKVRSPRTTKSSSKTAPSKPSDSPTRAADSNDSSPTPTQTVKPDRDTPAASADKPKPKPEPTTRPDTPASPRGDKQNEDDEEDEEAGSKSGFFDVTGDTL